jgi:hypothetical protein
VFLGNFSKTNLIVLFAEDLSVEGVVGSLYHLLTYRADLLNVLQKLKIVAIDGNSNYCHHHKKMNIKRQKKMCSEF